MGNKSANDFCDENLRWLLGEAKANELVSTNFFFEQGDCEFLEGIAKRLCLLHCEFLMHAQRLDQDSENI